MSNRAATSSMAGRSMGYRPFLLVVALLLIIAAFHEGLRELVVRWNRQEEYSHGFLIPLVSIWLLWTRRKALVSNIGQPSWLGPAAIIVAILMLVVAELSSFYLMSQLGFVLALMGLVLSYGGYSLLRVTFIPIAFFIFAIPLPYFLDSELSWRMQIISSRLGVLFIRMFEIPVYLTGNVIDLGNYKLQVAEACSGLRYLYPLLSFGFLAAYLFQAPFWQRLAVFLSAIPITIVMNSLRIGLVGLLVNRWGTAQAEGFLHFFEGWVIFLACTGILALEIWLLARLSGKSFFQVFHVPILPETKSKKQKELVTAAGRSYVLPLCLGLLLVAGIGDFLIAGRPELVPERPRFVSFPTKIGGWTGHTSLLEPSVEQVLKVDDYILTDYTKPKTGTVNFYVAYYATQRRGASPHSPIVCIPGGGWQITKFERTHYRSKALGVTLPLNRAVIARGHDRQLVYYWFSARGRNIANEYWAKWYLFVDAITKNRTDGALVRLVTTLETGEPERQADERLQAFIDVLEPQLAAYLPLQVGSRTTSAGHQVTEPKGS